MTTIMVVGAHPDDIEIGTGAAIHKFIGQGHEIICVDLTNGEPTPRGNHALRIQETAKSNSSLGITKRVCLDLPNRVLMDTEEARTRLAIVMREYRPKIILSHAEIDAHPDHVAAFQITRGAMLMSRIVKIDLPHEAWRPGRVFYYFCSHMKRIFPADCIIEVDEANYQAKLEAVCAYESQFELPYIRTHLETILRYYGSIIRCPYGEPYQAEEPLGLPDFEVII